MKGTSTLGSNTAPPSTTAGQTGPSSGLRDTHHSATGGPLSGNSAVAGENIRPDVNPRGAGHMHEGMSEASIKSGVIGFGGTGQYQEHAAMPTNNQPESDLSRKQILGGGNTTQVPTTADTSDQPSALKQALPRT